MDEEGPDPAGEASRPWPAGPQTVALDATAGSGSSSANFEEGFEEASEQASDEVAEEVDDCGGLFPAVGGGS